MLLVWYSTLSTQWTRLSQHISFSSNNERRQSSTKISFIILHTVHAVAVKKSSSEDTPHTLSHVYMSPIVSKITLSCISDAGLTEEEVLIENATTPETVETVQRTTLLLRMKEGMTSLATVLKMIEVCLSALSAPSSTNASICPFSGKWKAKRPQPHIDNIEPFCRSQKGKGVIVHLESRPSKQEGMFFDVLTKIDVSRRDLLILIRSLRQSSILGEVTVLTDNSINVKGKKPNSTSAQPCRN